MIDGQLVVRLDQPLAAATEHLERSMILYALRQSGARVEKPRRSWGSRGQGLYLKRMRLGLDMPEAQPKTA